ncbi:Mo-dependent nitrogenase C-terminal domain-containing protein [Microseira sp. BLCC-F43]|jgi:CRP-like cAMP-binding protein|uniref:Mo-dependent nitrogenase C-terminal domain-containing protein n=1 Tax=Microseira sp. BLCC-F43 TaxID=3153602 RepID=UPI0035B95626
MMLSQENIQLLQDVPIFRDIDRETALSRLALNLEEVQFPAGHTIFKQGKLGPALYILVSGAVEVHLGGLRLAKLGPGKYFGEMSLFDSEPHSASVTTLEPCKCLVLTQAQIYKAIRENPEIGVNIIRILSKRVRLLSLHVSAWLRGLLTIAWADGEYNAEEKKLIEGLVRDDLCPDINIGSLKPISGIELADAFGRNTATAENFLRTAVIVALANGTYSESEDKVLREFCTALGQKAEILEMLRLMLAFDEGTKQKEEAFSLKKPALSAQVDVLQPMRKWLDEMEIDTPYMARFLCKMIPSQCPFERDIVLFGKKIVHIPPMCKINPLYEQLVGLRFRALSYLADECKEDVTPYL